MRIEEGQKSRRMEVLFLGLGSGGRYQNWHVERAKLHPRRFSIMKNRQLGNLLVKISRDYGI
jgi:hypothetical protein